MKGYIHLGTPLGAVWGSCSAERRQAMSDPEMLRRTLDPANIQAIVQMQQAMQQLQRSGLMPPGSAEGAPLGFGAAPTQPPASAGAAPHQSPRTFSTLFASQMLHMDARAAHACGGHLRVSHAHEVQPAILVALRA